MRNSATFEKGAGARRFGRALALVCFLGMVLRLGAAWQLAGWHDGRNSVFAPPETTDLNTYMVLSDMIMKEGWPEAAFDYQPFYYTVYLPLVKWLGRPFGSDVWSVIVAQILTGTAVVLLAGLIGRRIGGSRAGILAAVLTAFGQSLMLYTPFHAIVTIQSFWLAFTLYCGLRGMMSGRLSWWTAAGISAGCGILTRGNFWFVVPFLLIAAWCRVAGSDEGPVRRGCRAALVLVLLLAVQAPYIWHNTLMTGELTGPSVASDKVLALGNSPEAPPGGCRPGTPAGAMEYPEVWREWMAGAPEVPVRERVFKWIREAPGAFLELNFRKALLFWDHREIPNNIGFRVSPEYRTVTGELDQAGLWGRIAFASSGVLMSLGLAGMLLTAGRIFRRGRRQLKLAWWWVVGYWAGVTAFYMLERFRAPVLPEMAVFGGLWLAGLWSEARGRNVSKVLRMMLVAAVAAWVVYFGYDFYRDFCEAAVIRSVAVEGVCYEKRDGMTVRRDNGSAVSGTWVEIPVKRGDEIGKRFYGFEGGSGELEIMFSVPGYGRVEVSDRSGGRWSDSGRFMVPVRVPVEADAAGWSRLRVESIPEGGAVVMDLCRDYGRTEINGERQRGEIVGKMQISP